MVGQFCLCQFCVNANHLERYRLALEEIATAANIPAFMGLRKIAREALEGR